MEIKKISENDGNNISDISINDGTEIKLNSFINKIKSKYNKSEKIDNSNIHIFGKILYYINDLTTLLFIYKIPKNSLENKFGKDIIFSFEFIHKKVPYVKVLSNFIFPTLFDGRNFFYFLTNNYNYIFESEKLEECEKIINEIIIGINKFLVSLKENLEIKVLIYYGDYTLNHEYLINDFLINKPLIDFYRIHDLNNGFSSIPNNINLNKSNLKYIIITQLYFLIFEPMKENKSYAKLIQIYHIKDVNIIIKNKDPENKTYYMKITKDSKNPLLIQFILIHRNHISNKSEKVLKNEDIECDYDDYVELKNSLDDKKEELNYGNYILVIKNAKNMGAMYEKRDFSKKKFISENRCNDYKKYIEYYEILYDYYKKQKNQENAEEVEKKLKDIFDKLTFFCVELITFKDSDPKENLIYKSKLEKYSKYCMG